MLKTRFLITLLVVVMLSGCASAGYVVPPIQTTSPGIYHKVSGGETLWGISKLYDISVDRIAHTNRLPDKKKIYIGQRLFIPGATEELELSSITLPDGKGFAWPARGKVVSFYGSIEDGIKNKGIDIRVKKGSDVVASRGGTVSFSDENMEGFGKTIIIDHGDRFSTVYAYNSRILVGVGDKVARGRIIAKAGDTGRAPTPRLHFEIRKNKVPRNPFYYLP